MSVPAPCTSDRNRNRDHCNPHLREYSIWQLNLFKNTLMNAHKKPQWFEA